MCYDANKNAIFNEKALKAFISLDPNIDAQSLLNHYVHRWPIETFLEKARGTWALMIVR
ncbi:hypothetical protein [Caldicoprobacter algeriensis]|uniref:hypothetical protein n=1 Tax=Caldicoprobacter algeriensis TaxID=699281 RepID=UPI00207A9F3A|nr:hypothetical protein [Caldicoprobacter algeriensis]